MVFKNKFAIAKMITKKYVGQWKANPDWNFARISQQLRKNTNIDTSSWQHYWARMAAREIYKVLLWSNTLNFGSIV